MRARIVSVSAGSALVVIANVILTACAIVPPFNQYSYDETARLKVESLALILEARQSSKLHEEQADFVLAGVNSAYRDANLRAQNDACMRLWETLLDPEQGSLAGAIRQWKRNDTLSQAAIAESRKLIAGNFDQISKLEGGKRRR